MTYIHLSPKHIQPPVMHRNSFVIACWESFQGRPKWPFKPKVCYCVPKDLTTNQITICTCCLLTHMTLTWVISLLIERVTKLSTCLYFGHVHQRTVYLFCIFSDHVYLFGISVFSVHQINLDPHVLLHNKNFHSISFNYIDKLGCVSCLCCGVMREWLHAWTSSVFMFQQCSLPSPTPSFFSLCLPSLSLSLSPPSLLPSRSHFLWCRLTYRPMILFPKSRYQQRIINFNSGSESENNQCRDIFETRAIIEEIWYLSSCTSLLSFCPSAFFRLCNVIFPAISF